MRPLTDRIPKPLVEVGGKTLLNWHIEKLVGAGMARIVVNHAHLGEQIVFAVESASRQFTGVEFLLSAEPEGGLETAGGIIQALPLLDADSFLVVNADIWCEYDLPRLASCDLRGRLAHLVMVDTPHYKSQHDFYMGRGGNISLNQADGRGLTFSGISVLTRQFFHQFVDIAALTSSRLRLLEPLIKAINADSVQGDHFTGEWRDIGTIERLVQLQQMLASR